MTQIADRRQHFIDVATEVANSDGCVNAVLLIDHPDGPGVMVLALTQDLNQVQQMLDRSAIAMRTLVAQADDAVKH